MKLFECQNCGQLLYFENTLCESCGLRLGYLPDQQVVTALRQADAGAWHSLATPSRLYRFCSINRSMGQPDLYPFVLSPPAISKLAFVHELIHGCMRKPQARS